MAVVQVFLAASLSGILLFLGFPPFEVPAATWIALVPLLVVLPVIRPAMAALAAFWCGIVFFWRPPNTVIGGSSVPLLHVWLEKIASTCCNSRFLLD
jgi:hypothetical protein